MGEMRGGDMYTKLSGEWRLRGAGVCTVALIAPCTPSLRVRCPLSTTWHRLLSAAPPLPLHQRAFRNDVPWRYQSTHADSSR